MSNTTLRSAVLAAFLTLPCAAVAAAVDYFLKIDGIEGESTDARHKGEIQIESWSWGVSSAATNSSGRAGKPCVSPFSFSKTLDKATPQLMANSVSGMVIKSALLTARKSGEQQQEYLEVRMENVLVSSYQSGGSSSALPMEQFSLNFERITVSYRPQKPDGSLGDPTTAAFQGGC